MSRFKCKVAYDGTNFSGWQVQPNARTVQGVIEAALSKIHKGALVRIAGSGRTDAQVHAKGQVFHFDSELAIPDDGWRRALTALLPEDVVISRVEQTDPDFHARFHVKEKEYRYRILRSSHLDVFRRNYTFHFPHELNVGEMRNAAAELIGTHDFSSFCASNTDVRDKVRTLNALDIEEKGDELEFRLTGNGFLYQMVRIVVGTLLEVGQGKRTAEDVAAILQEMDRTLAGKTAPGRGLFLWEIKYSS
jgi:tRNA pseudouridine38-40 synthase